MPPSYYSIVVRAIQNAHDQPFGAPHTSIAQRLAPLAMATAAGTGAASLRPYVASPPCPLASRASRLAPRASRLAPLASCLAPLASRLSPLGY